MTDLRAAAEALLAHIAKIEYRDKAGLRLSDVVPHVAALRVAAIRSLAPSAQGGEG